MEIGALTVADLVQGSTVDYFSSSKQSWLPVRIKQVDADSGSVELDLRRGTWLQKEEQRGKLRRHLKPGKAQLEWARSVLGTERFALEQSEIFERYASRQESCEPLIEGMHLADVAAELDVKLRLCGAILVLEEEAKPQKTLTLTKFGSAFWKLLHRALRDHSGVLNVKRALSRKGEGAGQDYVVERELKRGSYGQVRLVRERGSGGLLAVKAISKASMVGSEDMLDLEVQHLCRVDHPNIVKLRKHYEDADFVYLVMDYCSGGDLNDWLRASTSPPSEDMVLHLGTQLMRAMAHVHARGIVHLDIKGLNVMLTHSASTVPPVTGQKAAQQDLSRPHLMLIDLGIAQLFRPGDWKQGFPGGTPATMAPEVWRGEVTLAADVFSCGIVLWELCTLQLDPLGIVLTGGGYDEVIRKGLEFWERGPHFRWELMHRLPQTAGQLVQSMVSPARQDRPSARGCLESDFLALARPRAAPLSQQDAKVCDVVKQLTQYASRSLLYKSIAFSVARKWQPNQLPSVQRVFFMLDTTGSGLLDVRGAAGILVSMGLQTSGAQAVVKAMDLNKDGFVDWTEFVAASICLGELAFEPILQQHFRQAAGGQDCSMDKNGLAQLLPGYSAGDAAVAALFQEIGNGSPTISWVSFRAHFAQMSL